MSVRLFVWMCVTKLFYRYSFYNFSLILTKLGTHDLCANACSALKTVEQIFEINFKILAYFLKFYIWIQSLEQQHRSYLARHASSSRTTQIFKSIVRFLNYKFLLLTAN